MNSTEPGHCEPRGVGTNESAEAIHAEIERSRKRLDVTVDRIRDRLQPKHLINDAIGWARSSPNGTERVRKAAMHMGKSMTHWIEEHPVPTLLATGAVALYLYESWAPRRNGHSNYEHGYLASTEGDFGEETPPPGSPAEWSETGYVGVSQESVGGSSTSGTGMGEKVKAGLSGISERAGEIGSRAGEALSRTRERVRSAGTRIRERGSERAHRLRQDARAAWRTGRECVADAVDERPLAVGLGMLAMGVLAGLLIPETRIEQRSLGETSRRIRSGAARATEKVREAASAAASAAASTAEREGMTPRQMAQSAEEIAKSAMHAASEKVRPTSESTSSASATPMSSDQEKSDAAPACNV